MSGALREHGGAAGTAERREALRRSDRRARVRAREVFDRPFVLEAGAGTGKTTALVTRVVVWCLGPGWERSAALLAGGARRLPTAEAVAARVLQRVVAITFTDAAAAKMGEEIASALLAVERDALPPWLPASPLPDDTGVRRERARALRGALDHLGAQTIHAWCRRLLVAHPLEAGLHPSLEIDAERRHQEEIVREVLEERLPAAYDEPGSGALVLASLGQGPRELEFELLALLEAGLTAADLRVDPLVPGRLESLRTGLLEQIHAFVDVAGDVFHGATRARKSVETAQAIDRLGERLEAEAWPEAAALGAFLERLEPLFPERLRQRLADWARDTFGVAEASRLGDERDRVVRAAAGLWRAVAHLGSLDPHALDVSRRVLAGLLEEVESRMRTRGSVTFSALLTGAQDLLRRRPDVAARVRDGMDQLLVDEFQDTDRRQCDILRAVALSGPPDSRPGLFLVGDPKQSIYGWRSADLAAYDAFVSEVLAAGGCVERLSVNFRSVPAVLDEVERLIAPIMEREPGLQPAFQPLVPSPAHEADPGYHEGGCAPAEYWTSAEWDAETGQPAGTRAAQGSRIEARALARDLLALRAAGVAWRSVGVLFRSRADFEVYLSELRAAGVPYAVEGDRSYYQRREVIEASALLRCILDPNDHLALVAVLRSGLVGLPDAALATLWARDFPGRLGGLDDPDPRRLAGLEALVGEVAAALPPVPGLERVSGWPRNVAAFCDAVAHLRRSFREDPADVFVERLRTLTLFEAGEAARYLGAWRLANLDRFFRDLAQQLVEECDAHAVLRRLRRSVSEEEQREEGVPQDLAEDAVQVLTIHGAKGLDFAHVYVMQLHKSPGRAPRPGIDPGAHAGHLEYRLFGRPTLAWDRVSHERERVEEAERIRTLYVAMTRAESRLVLAGVWRGLQKSPRAEQPVALLERRSVEPPDLGGLMAELAAEGGDARTTAGARWVFPALASREREPGRVRERDDRGLPPLEECDRVARALRAAREAATIREKRGFGGTASAAAHEEKVGDAAERRFGALGGRRRPDGASLSRAVGTAVHRVLEDVDLVAEPAAEIERQRERLPGLVGAEADAAVREEAAAEASALLEGFWRGELFARLRELAGAIVARELPVLLPADPERGPAAFLSGVADLVYRDPACGRLVIVDYKTDRVDGDPRLDPRSVAYARQGAVYQRALREGLGLDYSPRFELWYLRPDVVVEV